MGLFMWVGGWGFCIALNRCCIRLGEEINSQAVVKRFGTAVVNIATQLEGTESRTGIEKSGRAHVGT